MFVQGRGVGNGVGKLVIYWGMDEINKYIKKMEVRFFILGEGSYKYLKREKQNEFSSVGLELEVGVKIYGF